MSAALPTDLLALVDDVLRATATRQNPFFVALDGGDLDHAAFVATRFMPSSPSTGRWRRWRRGSTTMTTDPASSAALRVTDVTVPGPDAPDDSAAATQAA